MLGFAGTDCWQLWTQRHEVLLLIFRALKTFRQGKREDKNADFEGRDDEGEESSKSDGLRLQATTRIASL